MWTMKLIEHRTGKTHNYKIKTCGSIQWYAEGDTLRVTEYRTGKTIKRINISKFGCCSIHCQEEL